MSSECHQILIVSGSGNSLERPGVEIKVSGKKLEEAESRLKMVWGGAGGAKLLKGGKISLRAGILLYSSILR